MGGFFGAASKRDVVIDVYFGVDYHSHLGTRRAGIMISKMDFNAKFIQSKTRHSVQNLKTILIVSMARAA